MEQVEAKTIVQRSKSTAWFGTEYNMNIYRGCCHGCIYCDSRSDCYQIADFGRVRQKKDALRILRDDLARKAMRGVVATGAMSDPYNPFEKRLELSRNALQLLDAYGFGVGIATKSDLLARDADILGSIRTHSPVLCKFTITTADDALAKKLEPHAPPPSARLAAMRTLSKKGIFCGVLLMPVMPYITDTEEQIGGVIRAAADAGARFIYPGMGVTMRSGNREYLIDRLEKDFPDTDLAARYRGFGKRYHCSSRRAKALWRYFTAECREHGLLYDMQEIVRAYKQGYGSTQLSFL